MILSKYPSSVYAATNTSNDRIAELLSLFPSSIHHTFFAFRKHTPSPFLSPYLTATLSNSNLLPWTRKARDVRQTAPAVARLEGAREVELERKSRASSSKMSWTISVGKAARKGRGGGRGGGESRGGRKGLTASKAEDGQLAAQSPR